MIGLLQGTLSEKSPPYILLDCHGVGYEIEVPISTFSQLPSLGEAVVLRTHLVVREDGHFLYGFLTSAERSCFRLLLKISGIGPRTALAALSTLSVAEFHQAIATQSVTTLTRIPGIGKKSAQRMLLELRDQLPAAELPATPTVGDEILQALLAMGFHRQELEPVLRQLPKDTTLDEGLRTSLKALAKPR